VVLQNPQFKRLFTALEEVKKILKARRSGRDGSASYMATPSHRELMRRVVRDSRNQRMHILHALSYAPSSSLSETSDRYLCPVIVEKAVEGEDIHLLWNVHLNPIIDPSLRVFVESTLSKGFSKGQSEEESPFILKNKVDKIVEEVGRQVSSLKAAVLYQPNSGASGQQPQQHAGVSSLRGRTLTEKIQVPTLVPVALGEEVVEWNAFSSDQSAIDFANDYNNAHNTSKDILFSLIDNSVRHRKQCLEMIAPVHASAVKRKRTTQGVSGEETGMHADELHAMWSDGDDDDAIDDYVISENCKSINNLFKRRQTNKCK